MHHKAPDNTHAMPLIKPPKMNQQMLPNKRIYLILLNPAYPVLIKFFLQEP